MSRRRKESRQTLESLKLNFDEDEDEEEQESKPTEKQISQVWPHKHRPDLELYQKLPKPTQSGSAVGLGSDELFPLRPDAQKHRTGSRKHLRSRGTPYELDDYNVVRELSPVDWHSQEYNLTENLQGNLLYSNRRPWFVHLQ